ncbi:MAG TPA: hypothetical protein VGR88_00575 [Ktedonobacterales bacterium]|nr:hypothetical protein [Ktedonobacterales bacterium]
MASEDYLLWIAAADELGLFWTLDDAPLSAQEAGVALRMNPDTVGGMLALLTSLGFLDVTDGRFSLNALSRTYLLPHSLYYKGPWLDLLRKRPRLTYDDLCEALRRDVTLPTVRGYQSYWVEHEAQGDPDLTRPLRPCDARDELPLRRQHRDVR